MPCRWCSGREAHDVHLGGIGGVEDEGKDPDALPVEGGDHRLVLFGLGDVVLDGFGNAEPCRERAENAPADLARTVVLDVHPEFRCHDHASSMPARL